MGKLIETIAQTMREIKQQELTRRFDSHSSFHFIVRWSVSFRIERLEASPRHANDAKEELDLSRRAIENLGYEFHHSLTDTNAHSSPCRDRILSDHELIAQYDEQISIDWRRISEIFVRRTLLSSRSSCILINVDE